MTTARIICSRHVIAMAATLAVAAGWPGHALAGEEDTPFALTLSETVTRDSNFSRSEVPTPETVSSTALDLSFNKDYGRQNYTLNGTLAANRYHNFKKLLNNDSKELSGNFRTGLLRDWEFSLGGSYNENLNPIQNNVAGVSVVRNLRKTRDVNTSLRYGVGGDWAIVGSWDSNTLGYSEAAYKWQDANQRIPALRVNYYVTDLLYYGVGYRQVRTEFPERLIFGGGPEIQRDTNIDLTVNWQLTGMSNLDVLVSRRKSSFASDDTRHVRSWNGTINWQYTPQGLFTYGLNLSRLTSADRQVDNYLFKPDARSDVATINNVTSLRGYANAKLTGKVSTGLNYTLSKTRFDQSNVGYDPFAFDRQRDTVAHNMGVTVSYQLIRSVGLRCGANMYSQTRDQYNRRFSGRSYDCAGSFTLQ